MTPDRVAITEAEVRAALHDVADPEIPTVSIVDLGMIGKVRLGPNQIDVELLPTFVGCPALELIKAGIEERLASFGRSVEVEVSFATPWSSDRISDAGRAALRRSGFAPPPRSEAGRVLPMLGAPNDAPIACPHCGSLRTSLENAFGPTLCRSIRHCADCRQPFEAFKPL
jgi:ring-1,2-phenylacetyl-CoA epoxidase subunit PaaD